MTSSAFDFTGALARLAAALLAPFLLASCGSGGVSGPVPVTDPGRITILPDTVTLYSGLPTTFTISGGTGSYIVSSSNQSVVRVSGAIPANTITVIPANVVVDTPVTLTVRDTGTTPLATSALTVRPGTVGNDITVTPTSTQSSSCAPAVCSGGDAIISTTISQGGSPLPARGVRLEVVTGDFRFITSQPGFPEVLEAATTVVSDQAGGVYARIRVLPGAANQTAVFQVTDLGTLAFRRATFVIAQSTGSSPGFFAIPDTIVFSGPNTLQCAVGTRADVQIFGGQPPYTIGTAGSAFGISQNIVNVSGGGFYVVANGGCSAGVTIPIVDSAGHTTTITVSNVLGTFVIPDLQVAPDTVTLSDCSSSATVNVAGGTGSFTVSNTSGALLAGSNPSTRQISIQRNPGSTATTPLLIGVASGDKAATVTVNLTGDALNTRCDGSEQITLRPSSVTLASCTDLQVQIFGGSGPYTVRSDNSSVSVTSGPVGAPGSTTALFGVARRPGTAGFVPPATVTVTDSGGRTRTLPVNATGTGAGSGTGPC